MCRSSASSHPPPARQRPHWRALYGIVVPQLAGLAVVDLAGPPSVLRAALRWMLALGIVAGMGLWVRANRAAVDLHEWCACAGSTVTVRIIESRRRPPAERIEAASAEEEYELTER